MLLANPAVAAALDQSTLAYLGTDSGRGPVVAPVVFAASGNRIWAAMPSHSARAEVLRNNPRVGLLMRPADAGPAVVACGVATVLDPARPLDALGAAPDALRAPAAMLGYVRRNAGHLLGVVAAGEIGMRVAISVEVDRVALVDETSVLHLDGDWAAPAERATDDRIGDAPPIDLTEVPADIAVMADSSERVAIGWRGSDGPVVLPGRWSAERNLVTVAAAAFDAARAELVGPTSLTFDSIAGTSLDSKRGMTIRGEGCGQRSGSTVEISVAAERISYWNGAERGSVVQAS